MATHYLCKRGSKQEFHDCAFNQKFLRQDLSAMHRVQVRRRSTLPTLITLHSALSCGTPRCQHVVPPCVPIFQCNVMWRAGGRGRGEREGEGHSSRAKRAVTTYTATERRESESELALLSQHLSVRPSVAPSAFSCPSKAQQTRRNSGVRMIRGDGLIPDDCQLFPNLLHAIR